MISFFIDTQTNEMQIEDIFTKDLNINPDEKAAFEIIQSFLPPVLLPNINIERRSKNYISMFCGMNDFLRLKYSPKAKWISLRLPHSLMSTNIDNPLFAAQINKKQLHWRANIKDLSDLSAFKELIAASCVYMS